MNLLLLKPIPNDMFLNKVKTGLPSFLEIVQPSLQVLKNAIRHFVSCENPSFPMQ